MPLIIGHRGASAHAPENTIAAFKIAVDARADGVEFDVRLAKDGVPVVIHDADLVRVAGRREKVSELTSSQLAKIDVGSWFGRISPGRSRLAFSEETIPSLEQTLESLTGSAGLIYIELKTGTLTSELLVDKACEVIGLRSRSSNVIVKSFDLEALKRVRTNLPDIETAALFEPAAKTVFRRRAGLVDMAAKYGANHISVHWSLVTRRLIDVASSARMSVTVWTVDHPRWIARANDLGIRSLITNYPAKMLAARIGMLATHDTQ